MKPLAKWSLIASVAAAGTFGAFAVPPSAATLDVQAAPQFGGPPPPTDVSAL
jgi:hypothetical protein